MNNISNNLNPFLPLLIYPPLLHWLINSYQFNNIIRQIIMEKIFYYYFIMLHLNNINTSQPELVSYHQPTQIHQNNIEHKEEDNNTQFNVESNDDKRTSNQLKLLSKKTKRTTKLCTACPHKDAIHYAKNMCSKCYHSKGRDKKSWNCSHTNKSHYALGLCHTCYQMKYIQKQVLNDLEHLLHDKNANTNY